MDPDAPPTDVLRVLTGNLANGRVAACHVEALLRHVAPDMALLQELAPAQADAVASILPEGLLLPAVDHTGLGIAMRVGAPVETRALPLRPALTARLGGTRFVNVHLAAPHVPPPWRAVQQRRTQVRMLAELVDAHRGPILLAGDLNATPAWPAYRRLSAGLDDLSAAAGRTWRPTARLPFLLRIDHVLGRGVQVHRVQRHVLPGGDHAALEVEIAVP